MAKDFGYENLMDYDSEDDQYYPNKSFEEKMRPIIEYYETDVFWSELSANLAKRDIQSTANTFRTRDEYLKKLFEIEGEYEEEFVENGVKNLRLVKDSRLD